jgi:zinc/manganese transport system permease protein
MNMSHLLILWPAMLAGLLVLGTHVPLGRKVLQRGIIFIDLAVAQAAATGAITSRLLFDHAEPFWQQTGALMAAIGMVCGLHFLARRYADIQEALIGGSFVLLASLAVLLVSQDPHGGDHLHAALSGQLLWVNPTQLLWLAISAVTCLLLVRFCRGELLAFYLPLAITVTASVQAIGIYLVFACLIFPALACRHLPANSATVRGLLIGSIGIGSGLLLSLATDLPSGPLTVMTLAMSAVLLSAHGRSAENPLQSGP